MGEADISRINVTKVIPETGPVLEVLAGLASSPNASANSSDAIFDALKRVSYTPALKPLLTLLGDSRNVSNTVGALAGVAPMIAHTDSSSSSASSAQLQQLTQLLQSSDNVTGTITGLLALIQTAQSANATQQRQVFALLSDSRNATASVDALVVLDSQNATQKAQLAPVLTLFQQSSNSSATLSALSTLMAANLSASSAAPILTAVQNSDESISDTLTALAAAAPSDAARAPILALGLLFNNTRNATQTLTTLSSLLQNNVTSSPSARSSFTALTSLFTNASNQTLALTSVASFASSASNATTAQLSGLQSILDSTTNTTGTLTVLQQVSSSNATMPSASQLVPVIALFDNSKNSTVAVQSVLGLTQAISANSTAFTPLLQILSTTKLGDTSITRSTLNSLMPMVMDNLNVNSHYRLAIFTLCRGLSNGKIRQCNSPHAVQSFVLRDILYDELESSDFKPYMQALDVQKSDMYLEGKLQHKEKSYVPAVRAVLAFNLLTIILSFFLLIAVLMLILKKNAASKTQRVVLLCAKGLAFFVFLFSLLSAAIVAAFVGIIKRDTYTDDYNVKFTTGSAYAGLMWTAFVLGLFAFLVLFFVKFNTKKDDLAMADLHPAAATSSSDEAYTEKPTNSEAVSPHIS